LRSGGIALVSARRTSRRWILNSLDERPNRQTLFTNGILRYSDRAPLSTSFSDFLKQFSCFKPTNRGVEGGARLVKRGGARLVKRFQWRGSCIKDCDAWVAAHVEEIEVQAGSAFAHDRLAFDALDELHEWIYTLAIVHTS